MTIDFNNEYSESQGSQSNALEGLGLGSLNLSDFKHINQQTAKAAEKTMAN